MHVVSESVTRSSREVERS